MEIEPKQATMISETNDNSGDSAKLVDTLLKLIQNNGLQNNGGSSSAPGIDRRSGFSTPLGSIVISGTGLGLPGSEKKLIIGEKETDGKVVIEVEEDEIIDITKEKTKIVEGDLETEDGDIIVYEEFYES